MSQVVRDSVSFRIISVPSECLLPESKVDLLIGRISDNNRVFRLTLSVSSQVSKLDLRLDRAITALSLFPVTALARLTENVKQKSRLILQPPLTLQKSFTATVA